MKKRLLTLALVCLALTLAGTASAAKPEPVGDRLSIFDSGSQEWPAGTPFHIMHGWQIDPSDGYPISRFWFEMEIDGDAAEPDYIERVYVRGEDEPLRQRSVFNFPEGMTGYHEFNGHWFAPCGYAVDHDLYPGPCDGRFDPIEAKTEFVQVTFTP